ncbi:MAG: NUDIX hydrolase, partial [Mycobacteriaceae bacterium]
MADLTRMPIAAADARAAAVLMLFAGHEVDDADVLLLERASNMRTHSGQIAFPGGALDPEDDGPVAAALREAQEETALDPAGVLPLAL